MVEDDRLTGVELADGRVDRAHGGVRPARQRPPPRRPARRPRAATSTRPASSSSTPPAAPAPPASGPPATSSTRAPRSSPPPAPAPPRRSPSTPTSSKTTSNRALQKQAQERPRRHAAPVIRTQGRVPCPTFNAHRHSRRRPCRPPNRRRTSDAGTDVRLRRRRGRHGRRDQPRPSQAVGQRASSPTSTELLWIVDAYILVFGCLLIPAGALADRSAARACSSPASASSPPAASSPPPHRPSRSCSADVRSPGSAPPS